MINSDNVRSKQLIYFCGLLADSRINNLLHLRRRFLEQCIHFEETLNFLRFYKLVVIKNEKVIFTAKMQKHIKDSSLLNNKQDFKRFFAKLILTEANIFRNEVYEFLDRFKLEKGIFEFKPIGAEKIYKASLRNLLIDFEVVDFCREKGNYFIPDDVAVYLKVETRGAVLNEHDFEAILLRRKKIGRKAEEIVLAYERQRLKAWKESFNQIEHTALIDVGAGYDVKSFDVGSGKTVVRYIEVKAISSFNERFFWSRNEIEFAKLNREHYYLYLVPFDNKSNCLLDKIKIIHDPFKMVLKNKKWVKTVELMSFRNSWTN